MARIAYPCGFRQLVRQEWRVHAAMYRPRSCGYRMVVARRTVEGVPASALSERLRQGLAWAFVKYSDTYLSAEVEARAGH
jgi:hypothetical protein